MRKNSVKKSTAVKIAKIHGTSQNGRVKMTRSNGSVSITADAIRTAPAKSVTIVAGNGSVSNNDRAVLDYITCHRAKHSVSPSTRDIQKFMGFPSQTSAMNCLKSLEKAGLLVRNMGNCMARAAVPMSEFLDDNKERDAIAYLRKLGYSVTKKKTKKMAK